MKVSTSLPDHVLEEIDLFARRLKRPRRTFWADAAAGVLRRVRWAIADLLDGHARTSVMYPPP